MQTMMLFLYLGGLPPWFYLLGILGVVVALAAQARVMQAMHRYHRVPSRRGLSGAEVARSILDARGLDQVQVEHATGLLGDHYDPSTRTLRLSRENHEGTSVTAVGVAAHEAGHALQHADGYAWLRFRTSMVPVLSLGSRMAGPLLLVGMILLSMRNTGLAVPILTAAVVGLACVVVFSLVVLPVEIDASRRALKILASGHILAEDEMDGARTVLRAAAYTYVAGAAVAVIELVKALLLLAHARRQ